jgi:hypothetical protein
MEINGAFVASLFVELFGDCKYSDDRRCSAGVPTGVFGAEDSAATANVVTIFCNLQ